MLEKEIEKRVCEYAKSRGWQPYKFTSPSHAGVCDRIMVGVGKVLWVEFKAPGKKPTPLQKRHHELLASLNHRVYVVDSVDLGKEIIDHESQQTFTGPHWAAVRQVGGAGTSS